MDEREQRRRRRRAWRSRVYREDERAQAEADSLRFFAEIPEDERAAVAWELSLELYAMIDPGSERRLPRSAYRPVRR